MSIKIAGELPILKKLNALRKKASADSPAVLKALGSIAKMMQKEVMTQIVRMDVMDKGTLYKSIRYEIIHGGSSIVAQIGPDGIIYAAIHEKGGVFDARIRRAMFRNIHLKGRYKSDYVEKDVAPDPRDGSYRARAYMQPAYEAKRDQIVQMITKAIVGDIV